jgi:diguanylate cyclase (GGDEF)-like protein
MVTKIINHCRMPVEVNDRCVTVSTSAGIAIYPADGQSPDELMHAADLAMYRAKDRGRDNFCFCSACP